MHNVGKWPNILYTNCRPLLTNSLSVFDHFVGLALKAAMVFPSLPISCGEISYNVEPYNQEIGITHFL